MCNGAVDPDKLRTNTRAPFGIDEMVSRATHIYTVGKLTRDSHSAVDEYVTQTNLYTKKFHTPAVNKVSNSVRPKTGYNLLSFYTGIRVMASVFRVSQSLVSYLYWKFAKIRSHYLIQVIIIRLENHNHHGLYILCVLLLKVKRLASNKSSLFYNYCSTDRPGNSNEFSRYSISKYFRKQLQIKPSLRRWPRSTAQHFKEQRKNYRFFFCEQNGMSNGTNHRWSPRKTCFFSLVFFLISSIRGFGLLFFMNVK